MIDINCTEFPSPADSVPNTPLLTVTRSLFWSA